MSQELTTAADSAVVNAEAEDKVPTSYDPTPLIAKLASDPNTDIEKFERLLAMQERMEDRRNAAEFANAMALCQQEIAEIGPIKQDRKNEQTRSKYATMAQIDYHIRPIYTKHGFSIMFNQGQTTLESAIRVTALIEHANGHQKTFYIDVPVDAVGIKGQRNKTDTHAYASAFSYGRRYLLLLIFNLSTEDDDGNAAGMRPDRGPKITDEQYEELSKLIEDEKVPQLLNIMSIDGAGLEDIPAAKFMEVKKFCVDRQRAIAAKAKMESEEAANESA